MNITVRAARLNAVKTQVLGVPVFGSVRQDQTISALDEAFDGALFRLAREEKFKGKPGQRLVLTGGPSFGAGRLILIGLGKLNRNPAGQVRSFAHRMGHFVRGKGLSRFALVIPTLDDESPESIIQWLAEGTRSGTYRYEELLTGDRRPKKCPSRCTLVVPKVDDVLSIKVSSSLRRAVSRGEAIADGVDLTRDLVNTPSNRLSPVDLAERAQTLAEELDLEITVKDETEIKELGMGLLSAVGQGSATPPRFVHMTYRPTTRDCLGVVVLVGKGVTFDSGGLSLKTAKGQIEMKCDMAGAAVVLGALKALARLGAPYEIHGLIPMAENMPGGGAYRPGDVFQGLGGKTVEVLNTDAEGRLILADALSYGTELKPDIIMDFATLTGACMVALGPYRAALFGSDEKWVARFSSAAERASEPFWRLPLAKELREGLRSQVADLRNIGGAWGGAITAALFLKEFVGRTPWLHLDIAGPAFLEKPRGFYPKGGTGFCVMTLAELLGDEPEIST